jgi:dTDP-4-dehydrorhamnose 3,5-epimerase
LKHIFLVLDQSDRISLHIPAGCANAWITLKDNTILHYYMSDFYKPDFSFGIRWNDPFFKINWPIEPVIISNKDQSYEDFNLEKFMKSGAV